jgi:hypothetical protein
MESHQLVRFFDEFLHDVGRRLNALHPTDRLPCPE